MGRLRKTAAGKARESRGVRRTLAYAAATRDEAQRSIRPFYEAVKKPLQKPSLYGSFAVMEPMGRLRRFMMLLFVLVVAACSPEEQKRPPAGSAAAPAYGDIMVEGSIGDASNLIPLLSSDSTSHGIAGMIFNGLIKYDKDVNVVGDLAESWEISKDGLVITFHLRKGIRWHDGHPFTAEDVLYTYRVTIDPKTPTAYAGDFLKVKKAEVLGEHTFRVTYDKPFAPALMSWAVGILPKHLLEGKDITTSPLGRRPIGTGPYRFKEWVTGQKIVLVSNPDYFEGRPYIDGYILRIIPDTATMFLELRASGIDRMGLTPLQYTRQTENNLFRSNYNKFRYLSFAYTYFGYNLKNPLFADKRVRQAIAYAVNREEIIDGVLLGLGKPATGPYKPGTWAYNPNVRMYSHDPKKAKTLLAEAGWRDVNGDGILEKDGQSFTFEILTNQGNEIRAKCAEIIQQRLAEVGIRVKIRVVEWAAFVKDFINKRKFDATILGWTIPMEPDLYDVWHSSKMGPEELNFISYKNAEVDDLIVKARETFNREVQKRCYDRIQEILAEEQPYLFLYVPDALPIINARFRGVETAPLGIGWNFIKWHVPKAEQKLVMTR
jgi:peptide/nickel transport system substrate-binding protein